MVRGLGAVRLPLIWQSPAGRLHASNTTRRYIGRPKNVSHNCLRRSAEKDPMAHQLQCWDRHVW
eukprot:7156119-Pyramimonas_sp.AAC.1